MASSFAWEEEYKKTWETQKNLKKEGEVSFKIKRDCKPNKRGIIRHFHIIVDSSEKIDSDGYLPNYRYNIVKALNIFIPKYFQENPISLLSLMTSNDTNEDTYIIVDSSYDATNILNKLGKGSFSLEYALNMSLSHLKQNNFMKEILLITPSITIRNSSDLGITIEKLKTLNIKFNCINLSGELAIEKTICRLTKGENIVPLDFEHFKVILIDFCIPKTINSNQVIKLLKFGFPEGIYEESYCACHFELTSYGYICPVCNLKVCSLPESCPGCNTQLISLINLSRSIYHQYPLQSFSNGLKKDCVVCKTEGDLICPGCSSNVCSNCDEFVHNVLNFCPMCKNNEEIS